MCYHSVAERCSFQSGHSKEGIRWDTSQNYIDIQYVAMQSRAASMTTLDKLDPSLTGRIRISTMICYAFLVYWATPKVEAILEVTAWPRVYRERNERQEHRFKRMIDHGALHTNDGRKKIVTADRHQQRAREKRELSLATAQQRVDKKAEAVKAQQDQGAVSASKGHGKRLAQRQAALAVLATEVKDAQHTQAQLAEQVQAVGPSGQRAERDFRKQTIMTIRTLLLENTLRAFLVALLGTLQTKVSLATILPLLFERSGARIETSSQVVYGVNTAGLSVPYRHLLTKVVEGRCAMDLKDQGKPIYVHLKDMSP